MRAYSQDLRQRIVAAVDAGASPRAVAERFQVAIRTVDRYLSLHRTSGSLAPRPIPGRPRAMPPDTDTILVAQLHAHPAATLAEHCERWAETTGIVVSQATMSRAITRVGWSRKKERWQPGSAMRTHGLPGGTR